MALGIRAADRIRRLLHCTVALHWRWILAPALGALAHWFNHPDASQSGSFLALIGIYLVVRSVRAPWCAALLLALFFCARGILGLRWMAAAFLVHNKDSMAMLLAGSVGPALLIASLFLGTTLLWKRMAPGLAVAPLGFAVALSTGEWLQAHLLTGLPWNLIAYSWIDTLVVADSLALWSAYGTGFLIFLSAAVAGELLVRLAPSVAARPRLTSVPFIMAAILWSVALVWSLYRSPPAPPLPNATVLRLVQGNISQRDKWLPVVRELILSQYIALSEAEGAAAVDAVIWPETAIPYRLTDKPEDLARIGAAAPAGGFVLTGAWRSALEAGRVQDYNSLLAIGEDGQISDYYDKVRLIPFAEAPVFPAWWPAAVVDSLHQLMTPDATAGFWDPGAGPKVLHLPGIPPFAPLICYEIAFPEPVGDGRESQPEWILNLSNDDWFAQSPGPEQHLIVARARALQLGLPVIRVANTGISAVIDASGKVLAQLPMGEVGYLDVRLPPPAPTLGVYSRGGNLFFAALWFIASICIWFGARKAS